MIGRERHHDRGQRREESARELQMAHLEGARP
jgi:hypothetical protein